MGGLPAGRAAPVPTMQKPSVSITSMTPTTICFVLDVFIEFRSFHIKGFFPFHL
jgi:hypothetical protein